MKNNYILAVDLDCTLLNTECNMSETNLKYITKLKEIGVLVVPVTGRTYFEIPKDLRNHKDIDYIIYSNGAGIKSKSKGQLVYSPIDYDIACDLFKILSSYDTFIENYTHGEVFVDKKLFDKESAKHYGVAVFYIPELFRSRTPIDNFYESLFLKENQPELINVFFHDMEEREECRKRILDKYPQLELTTSMPTNLEMMNPNINKGNALKQLCEILDIDIKNTIACGDSRNDIKLLKEASKKYVVSNACMELKVFADKVICSNDEDILKYLFDRKEELIFN